MLSVVLTVFFIFGYSDLAISSGVFSQQSDASLYFQLCEGDSSASRRQPSPVAPASRPRAAVSEGFTLLLCRGSGADLHVRCREDHCFVAFSSPGRLKLLHACFFAECLGSSQTTSSDFRRKLAV